MNVTQRMPPMQLILGTVSQLKESEKIAPEFSLDLGTIKRMTNFIEQMQKEKESDKVIMFTISAWIFGFACGRYGERSLGKPEAVAK